MEALTHDVVVVGGGPAGLAAALWLGRYRRDAAVIDSQDYRARAVEVSHGYLARDPQDPMDFLQVARGQVTAYPTVSYRTGLVTSAERRGDRFVLRLDDGAELAALRVVLATGVADACPDLAGFDEHYGASAFHCPACDGYDARDRDVIAYGWDEHLVGFATSLLDWARSVTVLTDGRTFAGDEACREVLARHGVQVIEEPATRMVGTRGDLQGVELGGGRVIPGSLLFFSVAHEPRVGLARELGCRIDADGYVAVDHEMRTSVPEVFAAGDATPGLQLAQVAAAQGAAAGIAAALSLYGESGSTRSPRPAPDGPGEVRAATSAGH